MGYEKRQHARTGCEFPSSYKNLGTERPQTSETVVRDISEGGIRFRTTRFVPVREKLLFRIQIPNQKIIEAVAQPAWIREIPSLSQYDIGAQFISLSDADREIIRNFLASPRVAVSSNPQNF